MKHLGENGFETPIFRIQLRILACMQSDWGLSCPITETVDSVEYMNTMYMYIAKGSHLGPVV